MDRTIKITLAFLVLALAGTIGFSIYNGYIIGAYRSTLTSGYSYSLSITTDHQLSNVTLFIPVPTDRSGNSPIVSEYGSHTMPGIPTTWKTALFDTGKATLLKISIPSLEPSEKTPEGQPYTISIAKDIPSEDVIDTADPVANSAVFYPVQNLRPVVCTRSDTAGGVAPVCAEFQTSLYADYMTDPDTTVTITTMISARNNWVTFGPKSNEYRAIISYPIKGETHGWAMAKGTLERRIGSYDYPFTTVR